MQEYTVVRAINHWRNGVTSRDFINRLLVSCIALYGVAYFLYTWLLGPIYVEYFSIYYLMITDPQNVPATSEFYRVSGKMTLYGFAFSFLFIGILAATETAFHKNVFIGEERSGFPLKLGATEFKVIIVQIVVYVCWLVALFVGYFGFVLAIILLALIAMGFGFIAEVLGLIVGIILFIAAAIGYLYFMAYALARLSPAAALTVHDDDIRFPEAWSLTKGIGKKMANAYLIVSVIGFFVICLMVGIFGYILFATGEFGQNLSAAGRDIDQVTQAFRDHLARGQSKFLLGCIVLVFSVVYPVMWMAWAGIPNLAVKLFYKTDHTFA